MKGHMTIIYKDDRTGFLYNKPQSVNDDSRRFILNRNNLRKLDPKVFEKAAEFVDNGIDNFSCLAVNHAVRELYPELDWNRRYSHADAWRAAFGPEQDWDELRQPENHPFWNAGLYYGKSTTVQQKQSRLTSLAMMAAIVRDAKASRGKRKESQK
jgi:hypothetical protein